MSVKTKTVFHDRACVRCAAKEIKCYGIPGHCCNACKDAKSGCIHSDRKAGECSFFLSFVTGLKYLPARKAKVAARAPSTTGTAGTSKSAAKAVAPIELSDDEATGTIVVRSKKARKEVTAVEEEAGEGEEEGPVEKDDEELRFLMRAELERMEARFIQVEGMMKEMAVGMKFVRGCMDRVEKRKRRD